MPSRRSTGGNAMAGPSVVATLTPELHPITKRLRKMWKFAAVCQFLFVFDEAFGMSGFETELLESDFESSQTEVIPDLMRRLLYTLTLDRTIETSNWEHHVRRQYLARDPEANKYGTTDAPVSWGELSLEDKIGTLHDLCEWQLQDAEKFRKLVKSDDEITTWRVSPIGWDSQDNAYWLFDDNRIWIQRPEPVVKTPAAPKAKGPAKKGTKRARAEAAAAKRLAAQKAAAEKSAKSASSKKSGSGNTPSRAPPRRGTRTSARFNEEDMHHEAGTNGAADGDSDSELSDLPDDPTEKTVVETKDVDMPDAEITEPTEKPVESQSPAYVEFEAIVVTRQEWHQFAQRFARSKDPNEKNLHHYIKNEVLDTVLAAMDEVDKQKALEQALANRKRSSRIAIKESEKEERERDRLARARMEEKMSMIRYEEEHKRQKEEEEIQAQNARENRIREREERLRAREFELENKAIREEEERERREKERQERVRRREEIIANGGIPPPSRESTAVPDDPMSESTFTANANPMIKTKQEDDWELNCEICGKAAINPPNEDTEIVCCEDCGVWQHVKCWNKFDKHILARPKKRDWTSEDFFCTKCRPPPQGVPRPVAGMVIKREKASPSMSGMEQSSQDPESPIGRAAGESSLGSPRPRIKLTVGGRDSPTQSLPPVPSQNPAMQRPPGLQPAEMGQLASSGPAISEANPPTLKAPPSSFSLPTTETETAKTQATLPSHANISSAPTPLHRDASSLARAPESAAVPPPHIDMQPPVSTRPSAAPASGFTPVSSSATGSSLGYGRPSQPASTSQQAGAPPSPQANLAPVPNSARSPSYNGGGMGSPGFRRPSQVSGSFPMRHSTARSPLSRAHDSPMENGGDGFSLGPPRAVSPSMQRGQLPVRFGTITTPISSVLSSAPSLPPAPFHGRAPPSASTPQAAGSLSAPGSALDVQATQVGSVAGTAFSHVGTASPLAKAHTTAMGSLNGAPPLSQPNVTSTAADAGSPFDAAAAASATAAANAARVLDNGLNQVPHLFSPSTHEHHQGSPPLLKPISSETPVELAPTHINPPHPPHQDRTY